MVQAAERSGGLEQALAFDVSQKKTVLLAKRKELDGMEKEGRTLRNELKTLTSQLRKLGGKPTPPLPTPTAAHFQHRRSSDIPADNAQTWQFP